MTTFLKRKYLNPFSKLSPWNKRKRALEIKANRLKMNVYSFPSPGPFPRPPRGP